MEEAVLVKHHPCPADRMRKQDYSATRIRRSERIKKFQLDRQAEWNRPPKAMDEHDTPPESTSTTKRSPVRIYHDAPIVRTRWKHPPPMMMEPNQPKESIDSYDPKHLLKPWALRHCSNCNRLWDRDRNACYNLMTRVCWLLSQTLNRRRDGPSYLCRQPKNQTSKMETAGA
jgi:hypothetical protein